MKFQLPKSIHFLVQTTERISFPKVLFYWINNFRDWKNKLLLNSRKWNRQLESMRLYVIAWSNWKWHDATCHLFIFQWCLCIFFSLKMLWTERFSPDNRHQKIFLVLMIKWMKWDNLKKKAKKHYHKALEIRFTCTMNLSLK